VRCGWGDCERKDAGRKTGKIARVVPFLPFYWCTFGADNFEKRNGEETPTRRARCTKELSLLLLARSFFYYTISIVLFKYISIVSTI
jgi:hypothetical protein